MDNILSIIENNNRSAFTPYQEEAIVSLALDHPEFFTNAALYIKPDMFKRIECQYVMAHILNGYEKYGIIPSRQILKSTIAKELTVTDNYRDILSIVDRKSNHREVPYIKEDLIKWAKQRAYSMLYSEEAIAAYHSGDFAHLDKIVSAANQITDVGENGFWLFKNLEEIFTPRANVHLTTGHPKLDQILNNGGPSPGEVFCWMAPTNVGKSIFLINNCISSYKGLSPDGTPGQDVLLISFEMDIFKIAMRMVASASGIARKSIVENKEDIIKRIMGLYNIYGKNILIYQLPPSQCSVEHIYSIIDINRKRNGFNPTTIVLDYLDLMVSRVPEYNKKGYERLQNVSTEVRGLAINTKSLVFTATQTNREGAQDGTVAGLTHTADSWGKQFALDYVVSLNQSIEDRQAVPPRISMWVCKNRDGDRNVQVDCNINYDIMQVREIEE